MIMLTKVVNNNKPEQRAKSMHILIFYFFKVCLFLFYFHTCINSKVKDLQVFQGVSRRKLCYFALFIPTFSTNSHHRLDIFFWIGQAFNRYFANTYLLWWMPSLSLIFSLDKNMKIHLSF